MAATGAPKTLLRRYAPFLIVVLAQAVLVAVLPSRGQETQLLAGLSPLPLDQPVAGTTQADGSAAPGGATPITPGMGATPSAAPTGSATPSGGAPVGGGAAPVGGPSGGATGTGGAPAPAGSPGQPSATADTSHCTPDGRQQGVTSFSSPCVPKFTGDNGGATYARGVTGDTVRVVLVRNTFGPVVDGALQAGGLAATPEEEEESMKDFAKFFNKRYETYGRNVEWSYYLAGCDASTDIECARTEARKIVTQFDPFMVVTSLNVLPAYHDELSKAQVVNIGGWHQPKSFHERLRPFHWDWMPDGSRIAVNVSDYWCKKLAGKPASQAGDPTIQVQERRLAIVAPDTEEFQELVDQLKAGMQACAGASVEAKNYKYSGGFDRAGEEFGDMVSDMRNSDITTVVCLCDPIRPIFLTSAATNAAYFPEHLVSGMGAADHDYFGRLYDQSQWRNAFGPGIQPANVPIEQQDDYLAYQDIGAEYRCFACLANFLWMHMAHIQLQYAGPNLNPLTLEHGTLTSPDIGGFENTGNTFVPLWRFGSGEYTALADSMEVWWSESASSEIDGRPGSYVCVQPDCRRFEIGQWPASDPKTPT